MYNRRDAALSDGQTHKSHVNIARQRILTRANYWLASAIMSRSKATFTYSTRRLNTVHSVVFTMTL